MFDIFSDADYQNIWFIAGLCLYLSLLWLFLWFDYEYNRRLALTHSSYRSEIRKSEIQQYKNTLHTESFFILIVGAIAIYYTSHIPYSTWVIACILYWNPTKYNLFFNFKVIREYIDLFKNSARKKP